MNDFGGNLVSFFNSSWIERVLIETGTCTGDDIMILMMVSGWTSC